ncbi:MULTISPECIES: hypothetical protein [Pseudomonas]|uniref:Uncharacterized protein n=1 Tax=Pseudomonas koreensis TaxID=198620 RepID=A0AA94EJ36_9PSED|nr:hypothetical protein [Pseudomonas koreensis]RVD75099.1 hypothetical protein A9HBioS_5066 [Pseudomonas koreensis]
MLNDDETHQSVEHTLTEIDHAPQSSDAPEESVALATRERVQPDANSTTKPHRNTGSLDSLGGGRLP